MHEHNRKWAKNKTDQEIYLCSWRMSDPSLTRKETEDEEGQVEPGAVGLLLGS